MKTKTADVVELVDLDRVSQTSLVFQAVLISFWLPMCFTIYRSQSTLARVPWAILSNPPLSSSAILFPHSMLCIFLCLKSYTPQRDIFTGLLLLLLLLLIFNWSFVIITTLTEHEDQTKSNQNKKLTDYTVHYKVYGLIIYDKIITQYKSATRIQHTIQMVQFCQLYISGVSSGSVLQHMQLEIKW